MPGEADVPFRLLDRGIRVPELDAVPQRASHGLRQLHRLDSCVQLGGHPELVVQVAGHQDPQLVALVLDRGFGVEKARFRICQQLPRPKHVELRDELRLQLRLRRFQQLLCVLQRSACGADQLPPRNQPVVRRRHVDGDLLLRQHPLPTRAPQLMVRPLDVPPAHPRPEPAKQRLPHEQRSIRGVETTDLVTERRRADVHADLRAGREPPRDSHPVRLVAHVRLSEGPQEVRRDACREGRARQRPAQPRLGDALERRDHSLVLRQCNHHCLA